MTFSFHPHGEALNLGPHLLERAEQVSHLYGRLWTPSGSFFCLMQTEKNLGDVVLWGDWVLDPMELFGKEIFGFIHGTHRYEAVIVHRHVSGYLAQFKPKENTFSPRLYFYVRVASNPRSHKKLWQVHYQPPRSICSGSLTHS